MSLASRWRSLRERAAGADATDPQVDAILAAPPAAAGPSSDTRRPLRVGRLLLVVGALAFLAWAALAPLAEGVPVHGFLKVEGNSKTIQHLRGGIVEEIHVREGERVAAGAPLLRLNDVALKAQLGVLDAQLVSALAVEARLLAERAEQSEIRFPEFLTSRKADPEVREAISAQQQFFRTRLSALEREEKIGIETIAGLEEQIQGTSAQEKSRAEQIRLFGEELASLKPLYEQGFVPRNRMFEIERAIAMMSGQRSEDIANIGRLRNQIAETRLRILLSRSNYRKEVETQLTDIQRQVADLKERRVAALDDLQRGILRAPIAGVVVDLAVHTVGGIVQGGQKLMDIVPADQALVVEVQIPTHLIDSVRVGLPADVSLVALDRNLVPVVEGELIYVSADRQSDPVRPEIVFYIGRVAVGAAALAKIGKHELQPGMPADVVIKTRERSLLAYLLKPLLLRAQFAFTER